MTGVILLDKPEGFTSFDAVAKIRGICHEKKCGHSGTLDPMATGVMTVFLGGATRFIELLPDHDKTYIADLQLGTITDTLDITGKVLETRMFPADEKAFLEAAELFTGEITQTPPMYSAVSVNGKRLYELARKGVEIERPERTVNIYRLEVAESAPEDGKYRVLVECSSGTYVRSLAADIGEKIGCGATLTALRRIKANGFSVDETVSLSELQSAADEGKLEEIIRPVDEVLGIYPAVKVSEAQSVRFSNGGELFSDRVRNCERDGLYRVYSYENVFLGIGIRESGLLKAKKILHT